VQACGALIAGKLVFLPLIVVNGPEAALFDLTPTLAEHWYLLGMLLGILQAEGAETQEGFLPPTS
jgi:hypothetical protein